VLLLSCSRPWAARRPLKPGAAPCQRPQQAQSSHRLKLCLRSLRRHPLRRPKESWSRTDGPAACLAPFPDTPVPTQAAAAKSAPRLIVQAPKVCWPSTLTAHIRKRFGDAQVSLGRNLRDGIAPAGGYRGFRQRRQSPDTRSRRQRPVHAESARRAHRQAAADRLALLAGDDTSPAKKQSALANAARAV